MTPIEIHVGLVAEWLRKHFPPPYPTAVKWVKRVPAAGELRDKRARGDYAATYTLSVDGKMRLEIHLSRRVLRTHSEALHTLIHEWAHCASHRHWKIEQRRPDGVHDEEWGLTYARIYRRYYDEGGWREALE